MIELEYLSYRDIEERTIRFAKKYNPNCIVPFPVEEIIEFDLGIDIIPIPNLQKDTTDYLLEKLAERLVNIFDVSIQVLKIRMEKEKLNIKLSQLF